VLHAFIDYFHVPFFSVKASEEFYSFQFLSLFSLTTAFTTRYSF